MESDLAASSAGECNTEQWQGSSRLENFEWEPTLYLPEPSYWRPSYRLKWEKFHCEPAHTQSRHERFNPGNFKASMAACGFAPDLLKVEYILVLEWYQFEPSFWISGWSWQAWNHRGVVGRNAKQSVRFGFRYYITRKKVKTNGYGAKRAPGKRQEDYNLVAS